MKSPIQIHETAFVTATYRASNKSLSKDPYSYLWANAKTDQWIKRYTKAVSKEEPYVHCLRNRYFIETITQLIEASRVKALINFGCGFSMYPFILPDGIINIEIDKPEVITYKKKKVENWISKGKLPARNIHYISKNFKSGISELKKEINFIIQDAPSFILIEGVLFFLNATDTTLLINLFNDIQSKGGYLGSVSFIDSIENTNCFKRLIQFYKKEVIVNSGFEYQTIPSEYYSSLKDYQLIEHEDYVSLSEKFDPKNKIQNGEEILNEHMYLLKK